MLTACTSTPAPGPQGQAGGEKTGAPKAGPAGPAAPKDEAPAAPATPAAAGEGEGDWLVWFVKDGVPTTRWLEVAGGAAKVLAERRALLVGEGAKIWRIERADASVERMSCECAETEDEAACKKRRKVTTLGLRAAQLGGGTTALIEAATGTDYGSFSEQELAVAGGVGSKLLVRRVDDVFACGVHPDYDHGVEVFDLAAGKEIEDAFAWATALPAPLRRKAAEEIHKIMTECEEIEGAQKTDPVEALASRGMFVNELTVALVEGAPELRWTFGEFVVYACSSDYTAASTVKSGLLPEAAPIGLVPLPPALSQALASIGSADAVGWSHLELGAEKEAALAQVKASPEPAWPSGRVSDAAEGRDDPVQAKVAEGRDRTRAKDYTAAIAAFDAALKLDGGLASAYSGRGYARLLAGQLEAAQADFEAALARSDAANFKAAVEFNLGQVAERRGDVAGARAAYTRSLGLREVKAVRAALDALAGR